MVRRTSAVETTDLGCLACGGLHTPGGCSRLCRCCRQRQVHRRVQSGRYSRTLEVVGMLPTMDRVMRRVGVSAPTASSTVLTETLMVSSDHEAVVITPT